MSILLRTNTLKHATSCLHRSTPALLLPAMQQHLPATKAKSTSSLDPEWKTIYRLPMIRIASAFNRLKVYQAIATAAGTPLSFALEQTGQLPYNTGVVVAAVGVSGLLTLSLGSLAIRNLLGFVYVNQAGDKLKLAYVDFWGRRKETEVALDDVVNTRREQTREPLLNFYQNVRLHSNAKLKYKLLQRHGVIEEQFLFAEIFGE